MFSDDDDIYSSHPSKSKRLASLTKSYNKGKIITKEKIVSVTKEVENTGNNSVENTEGYESLGYALSQKSIQSLGRIHPVFLSPLSL
jgi:hypothetical protein